MTEKTAYIGLGSNLNHPVLQIAQARTALANGSTIRELAFSSLYRSPPMQGSPQGQADYINAVMAIATSVPPIELLQQLQAIEQAQGRIRIQRWGERTLDLDILLYDELILNSPELTIPHAGITQRAFVLYPLYEIAPHLHIPHYGPLAELITNCPLAGLQRVTEHDSLSN